MKGAKIASAFRKNAVNAFGSVMITEGMADLVCFGASKEAKGANLMTAAWRPNAWEKGIKLTTSSSKHTKNANKSSISVNVCAGWVVRGPDGM